jgi:hypothetical protein
MGERSLLASALLGLAMLHLYREGVDAARDAAPLVAESLSLRQAMGEALPLTSSLTGAAMLALRFGDPALAARLVGAVDAALSSIGAPVEAEMRAFHRRTCEETAAALGEPAFESERRRGSGWSLDYAGGIALERASAHAQTLPQPPA